MIYLRANGRLSLRTKKLKLEVTLTPSELIVLHAIIVNQAEAILTVCQGAAYVHVHEGDKEDVASVGLSFVETEPVIWTTVKRRLLLEAIMAAVRS